VIRLSPGLRAVEEYPFEELDRRKKAALEAETPELVRDALRDAIGPISSYPRAAGLPEWRHAVQVWVERRFGVALDPEREILPTLGAKELVFSLAQTVLDPDAGKDLVLVTSPGYPIPERGARFAGAEVLRLPLREDHGFLPDLHAISAEAWGRAAILWLNYPNNPTGAVAPLGFFEEAVERCRAHGVLLASDEAYSELWFEGGPPPSALQLSSLDHVVALQTLSKRSSMTGYRSGFAAGDPALIVALKRLRPSVGVTPQEFVQRAAIAAWGDETHVEANRHAYSRKRRVFFDLFARHGIDVAGSLAGLYLWVRVPGDRTSQDWALELVEETGVVVAPGSFFGVEGEGYVRMAMVPTFEECERAAATLDVLLAEVKR
jgi:succinyldiaminopimelate transaminase